MKQTCHMSIYLRYFSKITHVETLDIARVGIREENRSPEMMLRRDIFISVQNLMTTDLFI